MEHSEWLAPEHALECLARSDAFPRRTEAEAVVLELLPQRVRRFLDLGASHSRRNHALSHRAVGDARCRYSVTTRWSHATDSVTHPNPRQRPDFGGARAV